MLRGRTVTVMALLLVATSAHGQSGSAPIKGYELYSWKLDGHWHYSLLSGTNRAKSYDEVTAKGVVRVGTSVLEAELKRLPRGTEVMWESDGPPGIKRPASGYAISFKHPSRKRIQRIRHVRAALLRNHPRKLLISLDSLRGGFLKRRWLAKRAWLLRGRPYRSPRPLNYCTQTARII